MPVAEQRTVGLALAVGEDHLHFVAAIIGIGDPRKTLMLPKMHRRRDAWRAAIKREWHLWAARRLYRMAEGYGRQRAKHFQLEEIKPREGL